MYNPNRCPDISTQKSMSASNAGVTIGSANPLLALLASAQSARSGSTIERVRPADNDLTHPQPNADVARSDDAIRRSRWQTAQVGTTGDNVA